MEADSTTYEKSTIESNETSFPFAVCPHDLQLYKDIVNDEDDGTQATERQLVERLQQLGLLHKNFKCPTGDPGCELICKNARVVDKLQWVCQGCNKRQPLRIDSFFKNLQCSLVQVLQVILAWSQDADAAVTANHFGVKPRLALNIFKRLDALAIAAQNEVKLGGENSVVLAEMYPDCMNRLSPDTTDQPHRHRILMLADTNHIPTSYKLYVIKQDPKNSNGNLFDNQAVKAEIMKVISAVTLPNSTIVMGHNMPPIEGTVSIQHLAQHCDPELQNFMASRIWRQAVTLCAASRDLCLGAMCAREAQQYLSVSLLRTRTPSLFRYVLGLIAAQFPLTSTPDGATDTL